MGHPRSLYWAIVMILGYAIIAVPTGIVTSEIVEAARAKPVTTRLCMACMSEGHLYSARFCRDCGERFPEEANPNTRDE